MQEDHEALNRFLVEVFNEILKTEEWYISRETNKNLSLRELHVIEAVCLAEDHQQDNRASAIAADLRVTAGTLTTAVTLLEKKGYLIRKRDEDDKRIVRIHSTSSGRQANISHSKFHQQMVDDILTALSDEETKVFLKALTNVSTFFRQKYEQAVSKKERTEL